MRSCTYNSCDEETRTLHVSLPSAWLNDPLTLALQYFILEEAGQSYVLME